MPEILSVIGHDIQVFILAMIPVIELRGAIPLGFAYGLPWQAAFVFAVLGNILPVPFIIWLSRPILKYLKRFKLFFAILDWIERRTMKNADIVMKYSAFGLMILVAIPLPGTGAWTGALLAALLNMRLKYALPAIVFGVLIAGFLVSGLTYGFIGFLTS